VSMPRGPRRPAPGRSVADLYPDLASEWVEEQDYGPADVAVTSAHVTLWQCRACGHRWRVAVGNRTRGRGCPLCSRTRHPGGSLATQHPELAEEWHPTENGSLAPVHVGPGSKHLATWACPAGHIYQCRVQQRVQGKGCPKCRSRFYPAPPGRSLATVYPDVAKEWVRCDLPGATAENARVRAAFPVTWRCSDCLVEWSATVQERTRGNNCPACAPHGFNPALPAMVYLQHHADLRAWKVGITGVRTNRLADLRRAGWSLRHEERFTIGADARAVERDVLTWWRRDLQLPVWLGPEDLGYARRGWTETIEAAALDEQTIIDQLRTRAARHRTR
jgi:hypothetical protein